MLRTHSHTFTDAVEECKEDEGAKPAKHQMTQSSGSTDNEVITSGATGKP